jgi:hypothetical protein
MTTILKSKRVDANRKNVQEDRFDNLELLSTADIDESLVDFNSKLLLSAHSIGTRSFAQDDCMNKICCHHTTVDIAAKSKSARRAEHNFHVGLTCIRDTSASKRKPCDESIAIPDVYALEKEDEHDIMWYFRP